VTLYSLISDMVQESTAALMDRRRFLSLSAFYTVAAASGTLSACHSGDDHGNGGALANAGGHKCIPARRRER